jgi:hypothetical protein
MDGKSKQTSVTTVGLGDAAMNEPAPEVTSRKIFCTRCVAATSDKTPGDVSTLNGIGRQFYGSAAACPECASVIRTLWWTFVSLPVVPLGSYRYKTSEEGVMRARFWCRKLPGLHWAQVGKTWLLGLVLGAAAIIVLYLWSQRKR